MEGALGGESVALSVIFAVFSPLFCSPEVRAPGTSRSQVVRTKGRPERVGTGRGWPGLKILPTLPGERRLRSLCE